MQEKLPQILERRRTPAVFLIVAIVVLAAVLALNIFSPKRSVNEYCKVYLEEKSRLSLMSKPSNPYPSGLFNVDVDDAGQVASSLSRLDRVAPHEIEPEVSALQKLYQELKDDPSRAVSISLSGGSLDDNLASWTASHCKS